MATKQIVCAVCKKECSAEEYLAEEFLCIYCDLFLPRFEDFKKEDYGNA